MSLLARLILVALALAGLAGRASAQQPPTLVFTAIPDEDETRLVERFTGVAKYLEAKLGVPVQYLPVKTYPASVTAFTNNQVQLAWFGGFSGVQARLAVPGSDAIARGLEDAAFKSFMIANVATGLKPQAEFPKDIAGKSFTFGARTSTSGRVYPEHFIRGAFPGKTPEQVFSRVGFSGDHTKTIQLVQSGAYDVGMLDYLVWQLDVKAGKVDASKVQVIWESPTFPDYHWVVRGDVDKGLGAGFKDKLTAALLGFDDARLLGFFGRSKFVPARNEDYKVVEEVGRQAGLLN